MAISILIQATLLNLDSWDEPTVREFLRQPLLKIAATPVIPKHRMRRLVLILAEAANSVAEELKE